MTRFAYERATRWRLRTRTLELPIRPLVMGIVNVTPDSFSDGGRYLDPERAITHGRQLIDEGAELLDIGGESTRPYSTPVTVEEELRRVLPVVRALARDSRVIVSIDTSKPAVARAAVEAGAEIINDITGMVDPEMLAAAVETRAGVCAMHMQGTPQTMQISPQYDDIVPEIFTWLADCRDRLLNAGIPREQIALDPGIGFGKTHQHNLTLLAGSHLFHALGCPLLLGPSRKGFIGKVLGDKITERVLGTVGVVLSLAAQGVQMVRVHDVSAVRQALLLFEATGGIDGRAIELEDLL